MNKNNRGKFAVNVSMALSRRDSRPGALTTSTRVSENDVGRPSKDMKEELPSQAHEGKKLPIQALVTQDFNPEQEEETELDDVVPSQPLNILHPQLRLASDGHTLIVDEESLVIVTTKAVQKKRVLESTPAIVDDGTHPMINIIKGMESKRWSEEETQHFFLALSMLGLDFTLMAVMFPGRERKELQRKFLKEISKDPNLLEKTIRNKEPLDEEKLRAGPRRVEVANMAPQVKPGSGKKKSKVTLLNKSQTPLKRKVDPQQMDDTVETTTGPPEKKLKSGENGTSTFQPAVPQKVDSNIIPIISNIVTSFYLGTEVELREILKLHNAEFNPRFPSCVTLHLDHPKTSANVFFNGKVSCMGATTLESARTATRIIASLIEACGFPMVKYLNFKVSTISATNQMDFLINLEELFENNRRICRYQPQIFPGVKWKMEDPKVKFVIFASGSINLSGGKTMKDVCDAFGKILKIVEKYKK